MPAASQPVDPQLADPLADLRGRFLARSRERLDELAAIVASPMMNPSALDRLVRLAHQLAGSAGTFGCVELGRAAARLEDAARELVAPAPGDSLAAVPRSRTLDARLAVVEAALADQLAAA